MRSLRYGKSCAVPADAPPGLSRLHRLAHRASGERPAPHHRHQVADPAPRPRTDRALNPSLDPGRDAALPSFSFHRARVGSPVTGG